MFRRTDLTSYLNGDCSQGIHICNQQGDNSQPTSNHTGPRIPVATRLIGKLRPSRGRIHENTQSRERRAARHQVRRARKKAAVAARCSPSESRTAPSEAQAASYVQKRMGHLIKTSFRLLDGSLRIPKLRSICRSNRSPSTKTFAKAPPNDLVWQQYVRMIKSRPPDAVAVTNWH